MFGADFTEMERELGTLLAIKKLPWLLGKDFQVMYQGHPVWTILIELHEDGTFLGYDERGNEYPGRIHPDNLRIGRGTRLDNDPILLALQDFRLDWQQYAIAVPGFGAFLDAQANPAPGVRGVPPMNAPGAGADARQFPQVQIPQAAGGAGLFGEQTPAAQTPAMRILQGGLDNPFHPASAARRERTIRQLVSKGTLDAHLSSIHWEINPKLVAWYSKASYLLEIYQEPDTQVAHLLAAVFFYATRINYVSPDLEWLANAYVAEMKMKIEEKGDSTKWTPETSASLEAEIRHAYKAKADTLLGKGVVRPLFDPDKPRLVNHAFLHEYCR
jgi:hypothetical protein